MGKILESVESDSEIQSSENRSGTIEQVGLGSKCMVHQQNQLQTTWVGKDTRSLSNDHRGDPGRDVKNQFLRLIARGT